MDWLFVLNELKEDTKIKIINIPCRVMGIYSIDEVKNSKVFASSSLYRVYYDFNASCFCFVINRGR